MKFAFSETFGHFWWITSPMWYYASNMVKLGGKKTPTPTFPSLEWKLKVGKARFAWIRNVDRRKSCFMWSPFLRLCKNVIRRRKKSGSPNIVRRRSSNSLLTCWRKRKLFPFWECLASAVVTVHGMVNPVALSEKPNLLHLQEEEEDDTLWVLNTNEYRHRFPVWLFTKYSIS